jgi:dihydrofolate reductase
MRRLVTVEFITLDGIMQGLGSPEEDRDGGFEHGGWGAPYLDGIQMDVAERGLETTTAYLFGRRTYQKMAQFWPPQPDSNPMAAHLNRTPKYVATSTLKKLDWSGAQILEGELESAVGQLKATGEGDIAVLGSGVLVHELMKHQLVDEYRLFLHPLLLGSGKRLFRELDQPQRLRLTHATPTGTGVLMLTYVPEQQ